MLNSAAVVALATTGLAKISIGINGSSAARMRTTNNTHNTSDAPSIPTIVGESQAAFEPP